MQKWTHSRTWPEDPDSWHRDRQVICDGEIIARIYETKGGMIGSFWSVFMRSDGRNNGQAPTREKALGLARSKYENRLYSRFKFPDRVRTARAIRDSGTAIQTICGTCKTKSHVAITDVIEDHSEEYNLINKHRTCDQCGGKAHFYFRDGLDVWHAILTVELDCDRCNLQLNYTLSEVAEIFDCRVLPETIAARAKKCLGCNYQDCGLQYLD
ncbi:MAG: hypothetical protein AAGF25_13185 [Pseudomonadota bacterium]